MPTSASYRDSIIRIPDDSRVLGLKMPCSSTGVAGRHGNMHSQCTQLCYASELDARIAAWMPSRRRHTTNVTKPLPVKPANEWCWAINCIVGVVRLHKEKNLLRTGCCNLNNLKIVPLSRQKLAGNFCTGFFRRLPMCYVICPATSEWRCFPKYYHRNLLKMWFGAYLYLKNAQRWRNVTKSDMQGCHSPSGMMHADAAGRDF